MTLEPRMLAVEERLQRMANGMPSPDVDTGWAAISAQLEPTLAPVIPLRRRRLGRPIALAAAAALLVAGSALAAVMRGGVDSAANSPVVASDGSAWGGPHLHAAFSGPPIRETSAAPPSDSAQPVSDESHAPTSDGSDAPQTSHEGKAQDDPLDRDQGTGNDGRHDDNGGGNDGAEGTRPHGKGHAHGQAEGQSSAPSDPPANHGHGSSDHAHANAGANGNGH
jgi:hypothetical protein